MQNLVIVESPAKAKTIEKFLGKDYKVMPSYGHIRDLKKKTFSIDVEEGFKPVYEIPADKTKVVSELKSASKKADMVWLASDEDREGEAISWHLREVLGLKPEQTRRIVFHEITKNAILNAIEHPRDIDINLVNAQQARRVLDRIVGFELSPVLWKKVKPSLSAGRVQSVTVRLIVEREREIQAFTPKAAYHVTALFCALSADGSKHELKGELGRRFETKEEAADFLNKCKSATFSVSAIEKHPLKKCPAPPFTTSTLQQEAGRRLGFTVSQTMMVAQRLYESGRITYMRTDSVNLSSLAIGTAKKFIADNLGNEYVHTRQFTTKSKGAQEAHEAIRPTYITDETVEGTLQEKRLYDLIWKRTLASQMADAETEKTTVTITMDNSTETFSATGEVVTFDGFMKIYHRNGQSLAEEADALVAPENSDTLPPLSQGQQLTRLDVTARQRFTLPPSRYTEAGLVHKLEELGIGRPSTYAPTISTIQQREYVKKDEREGTKRDYNILTLSAAGNLSDKTKTETTGAEKGKLSPTDIGLVVNDFLKDAFPDILDFNFTANVEKQFDEVAEGNEAWTVLLHDFYKKFHPSVDAALATKNEHKVGERILGTDPKSGKPVSVKIGRFGPMAQIGSADDEEKPKFAQLKKDMSIETVSLDEVLELFKLPRNIGEYEGKIVTIGAGRFGPYIYNNGVYTSIPKGVDPLTVELEEAVSIIMAKREADAKKHIKKFDEEPEMEVMNGRFGPYIAYKGVNYRLPKTIQDPTALTVEQCRDIIAKEGEKEAKPKRRYTKAKKA